MKQKYFVEGSNFRASILIDPALCRDVYIEAATQVVECLFKDGPDAELSDELDVEMMDQGEPALGLIVKSWKDGDGGNEDKEYWMRSKVLLENAGIPKAAALMDEIEKEVRKQAGEV